MTEKRESMLHEVLAVESDLRNTANKILDEAGRTFDKASHFTETLKKYEPFNDEDRDVVPEVHTEMVTTVHDKLQYVFDHLIRYIDAKLQKEATNQDAKADVVIGDRVIAENVPATMLLGLETELKGWRKVLNKIPTLQPGIKWEKDESKSDDVWVTAEPIKTLRTKKVIKSKVLYDATKEHPAQIDKWSEDEAVGTFTKIEWSGMLSPAEKSELLSRLDSIERAVKEARQRANTTTLKKVRIGHAIFSYLMGK